MRLSDNLFKAMQDAGFIQSNTEIIIDIIVHWIVIAILAGGFVYFFSLSWGQSFIISWLFNTLIVSLKK